MFLLGLLLGGSVIYWFSGASTQAVSTGAYRAVEFIKKNIKLDAGAERASVEDSKKVVEICTLYAQKGMFNIFLVIFFSTLAFAFYDSYFFIGYLIAIAIFGLFQALFMANAGGAWDNAKKLVEVELKEKGHPSPRRLRRGGHGRRPLQGHVFRRHEPDHQVHDPLRPPRRGARDRTVALDEPGALARVLRRVRRLRLSLLLRDADRDVPDGGVSSTRYNPAALDHKEDGWAR